jgi:hypothetical protein
MVSHLFPHLKVVKHKKILWPARADAETALNCGYEEIKKVWMLY